MSVVRGPWKPESVSQQPMREGPTRALTASDLEQYRGVGMFLTPAEGPTRELLIRACEAFGLNVVRTADSDLGMAVFAVSTGLGNKG
jgi:hypothetical protein